jgi:hypothetical protein
MKLIKTLVVAAALAVCTTTAKADFQINFTTFNATNPALGFVTQVGSATPVGAGVSAQLYAGLNAGSLSAIGTAVTPPLTGVLAGHFFGGLVTVTSGALFGGSAGVYQLRAWDNNGGTITSWDNAVTRGESSVMSVTFGGTPNGGGTPIFSPDANLHPSFSLVVIPEPSTIALGILGISGLLLRRRRE